MIYNIDMNLDDFKTNKNSNDFTLTVKTVNDAPVMLQPIEALEILGDSWVAAVVRSTKKIKLYLILPKKAQVLCTMRVHHHYFQ